MQVCLNRKPEILDPTKSGGLRLHKAIADLDDTACACILLCALAKMMTYSVIRCMISAVRACEFMQEFDCWSLDHIYSQLSRPKQMYRWDADSQNGH